jgi:hypothetical protein
VRRAGALLACLAGAALLTAGCGGTGDGGASAPAVTVPGRVLDLAPTPGGGPLYVTTDAGVFRITADWRSAARVSGHLLGAGAAATPVGKRLLVVPVGQGQLLASGHPDGSGGPQDLGLLASRDAGRTWTSLGDLEGADLHALDVSGGRMVAFDLANERLLTTTDFGRTWTARRVPAPVAGLAADPAGGGRLVASTMAGLMVSDDAGARWRPLGDYDGALVTWPRPDALAIASPNGVVRVSADGGETFRVVGNVGARPAALGAQGGRLVAATAKGDVRESADGGATWRVAARLLPAAPATAPRA